MRLIVAALVVLGLFAWYLLILSIRNGHIILTILNASTFLLSAWLIYSTIKAIQASKEVERISDYYEEHKEEFKMSPRVVAAFKELQAALDEDAKEIRDRIKKDIEDMENDK